MTNLRSNVNEDGKKLDIKLKVHHIAFLNHILLSFESQLTSRLSALLSAVFNVIIVTNHFCLDEASFKIGVYCPGSLWRQ